ncbi:hypothetical protein MSAN_02362900 [Mycena sanguinolenta]|uniref:Sensor domain-containing protein n=1 Tax=Mycena sanguinolenta TaxID=230812 RepID=A0A8H6X5K6_9AGAR|nr:hypothetical protein MSAN_02362900 [Mycena sanguinolenta]
MGGDLGGRIVARFKQAFTVRLRPRSPILTKKLLFRLIWRRESRMQLKPRLFFREDASLPDHDRSRIQAFFSSVSVAPSLAQTVASLFRIYDDADLFGPEAGDDGLLISAGEVPDVHTRPEGFLVLYYRALFHLYVVNFPFALAAFLFAVVFTVTGTTLLVALPLGALLCFFNLFGLALQTKFHTPLAYYSAPHPPRPIFTRVREVTASGVPVPETSFYKNTYAMFTDPTSYQALFYFLVIKPSITLLLSLGLLVVGVPAIVLVGPAPMAFRAIRNLGIWQANIAVEGLYLAVR